MTRAPYLFAAARDSGSAYAGFGDWRGRSEPRRASVNGRDAGARNRRLGGLLRLGAHALAREAPDASSRGEEVEAGASKIREPSCNRRASQEDHRTRTGPYAGQGRRRGNDDALSRMEWCRPVRQQDGGPERPSARASGRHAAGA